MVDGGDGFVVCSRFALGGLAVLCLENDVDMFADACVIEVKFSETVDAIGDVVEEVESEVA